MQNYDKLRPLLEEFERLDREWGSLEPLRATGNQIWNVRLQVFHERKKELQTQIQQLTREDRRLVN